MKRRITVTVGLAAGLFALSSCGLSPEDDASQAADGHYPVTVTNCGQEVTFTQEPERLVLLKPAPVTALHQLGVLDRAVARAGAYPAEYFDDETQAELDDIEQLTGNTDPTGHLHISKDVVIDQEPDVVFGEVENLSRDSLDQVGIPLLEEPALCSTGEHEEASFAQIDDHQLRLYGEVFNKADEAEAAIDDLHDRRDAVEEQVAGEEERTAAVLYPTVGGGTTYAYGTGSMSQPQLEVAGFTNVFDDVDERVFEVTAEELIDRDPDVLILLYSDGEPEPVKETVEDLPGADAITAVKNDDVLVQLMNFTEPATPLAVDGLEQIVERFYQ